MFDFEDSASEREKCFTTISQLPTFVDLKKIPSKKSPFSAILNHPLAHTVSDSRTLYRLDISIIHETDHIE